MARMSKDYRHCRAGLPDLVVWNTSNNSFKVRPHYILLLAWICGFKSGYMDFTSVFL